MSSTSATLLELQPERVDSTAMVDYLARWYRLGGGHEHDIRTTFGLSAREYFSRVLTADANHLPPHTRTQIRSVARRRLWLAS